MRRRRSAAGVALVGLLLAGCGSTVQMTAAGVVAGPDGLSPTGPTDGLAIDGSTAGPDQTSGTTAGGIGSAAGTPQSPGSASAGQANGDPSAPRTGGQAVPAGQGQLAAGAPLRIGVITQPILEEAADTLGFSIGTGDTRRQVEAVIDWVEANGGFGGHPVELFEYAISRNSGGSVDEWSNAACTAFSQDFKVRFAVTVLGNLQTLTSCLNKYGIGLLADNANLGDRNVAKYAGTLGHPSELGYGRTYNLLVDDLVQRNWLQPTSKIGILAGDAPDYRETVRDTLLPALRRHGLQAVETIYINPESGGDGGNSQSSAAVLKFRSKGVDRVIPVGYSPLYMMIAAESQGFRPAYALTSAFAPALLETAAPAGQLRNAAGIGWLPYLDIGRGKGHGPVSPRETLCFDIMARSGQPAESALVRGIQAQVCDVLFYLKDLADLQPTIPQDLFTSARIQLGSRFVSPATFKVDVTRRTNGVAAYRAVAYQSNCGCFQYVSPVVPAP